MVTERLHSVLSIARSAAVMLALVGVMIIAAGCSGYQAAAWKDDTGKWLRWTPPNGDWRQADVNVYCPAELEYCKEAERAFSEWSGESIHKLNVTSDITEAGYVSRWKTSDIDYEIQDFGPTGWIGLTSLKTCVPTGRTAGCRSARAYTNTYKGYSAAGSAYARQAIACQEMGHIFGLDHANGDCMGYSYEYLLGPNTSDRLEPHSTDGIAALRYVAGLCGC